MSNPIDNGPRVGGTSVSGARSQGVKGKAPERAADTAPASAPAADTTVTSARLQQVREAIDNTPEVDQDRVDAIKQAIAEGRFPVNARRIAEKFAEFERLLGD